MNAISERNISVDRLERALSDTGVTTSVVSPAFLAELEQELAAIGAELTFFAIWAKAISSSSPKASAQS